MKIIKSNEEFNSLINSDSLVVIDFFATWCGPCKMLSPVLENVSNVLNNVEFIKVDIDQFNELASQYKVQSVPTIVFVKNGNEINRHIGYIDEDTLVEKIKNL